MGTTVTIDKSYFETLLRRAEFQVSGEDFITPPDLATVSIPKVDHDNLLRIAHEYMRLRDALYRGGITPETLEILIRGEQDTQGTTNTFYGDVIGPGNEQFTVNQAQDASTRINASLSKDLDTPFDFRYATKSPFSKLVTDRKDNRQRPRSSGHDEAYFPDDIEKDESVSFYTPRSEQPSFSKLDQRTIIFKNISDRTTHQDIVNVVRGGSLLDVYLRSQEKAANVSFVRGSAAQDFMAYVKRNDIYIHGRRLTFVWADRQYVLSGHLANKIGIGATRNLVIRGIHSGITEQRLREDLDHIHNLIIIGMSFTGGDVYLSLNSIRNSLFARTCMMSRAMYKGLRIDWYPDECALPLPKLQNAIKKKNVPPPETKETPMINRFQLLNMDDEATADGSSFEEDDNPTMTSGFSPLQTSRRTPWDVPTAAA